MSIGTRMAVVALDNIDAADRERVRSAARRRTRGAGHHDAEMQAFAGNVLELGTWDEYLGDMRILVDVGHRAARARRRASTRGCTPRWTPCSRCPVDVIERHGGGSVRCMLAEVFLR